MKETVYKNEYMYYLFRYIENNMETDFNIDLLSNISYVSRDKLYRDFYSLSGHSIKEYVRKRRLSNALALIKTSDMNLTDIAFQCGYSSYLTLWRTIKQTLGLTPSEYKNSNIYYFFPPWSGEPLQSVTVSSDTIPNTLRILFYHSTLTNIENIAVNTFLKSFPNYNEKIFGRNGKQKGNKFCYEIYLTNTDKNYNSLVEHGFEITQLNSCLNATFATTTVRNNERKINAAWDYLHSEWLQNSMFEYTDEPYYEEYILKNGKPTKLKLYLPIREREDETKIILINNPGLHFITAIANGYNAEEIASKMVMDYLKVNYPYMANDYKEIYLHKEINTYVCGIRINSDRTLVKDKNIVSITTDQNNYLVLESSVMGGYDRYAEMIFAFARDNGMDADKKGIFAVYDAKKSFRNPKIKIYCPINIHTK